MSWLNVGKAMRSTERYSSLIDGRNTNAADITFPSRIIWGGKMTLATSSLFNTVNADVIINR
jgi:hypothetical protein